MQPHDEKSKLKDEIIAWITGFLIEGSDYDRKKVDQAFDPNWTLEDLLAETKEGHNALWLAAKVGATEKFLQILEIIKKQQPVLYRAQFYKKDNIGRTILHDAVCIPNNQKILKTILQGVAANIRTAYNHYPKFSDYINTRDDEYGKTAFHMAAHYELWENMVMLLNYEADPFVKDGFDAEAFEYIKGKKPAVVTKFVQYLELASVKDRALKTADYKQQLREELQLRRDSILGNSRDSCEMIKRYYKDAIQKFSLIAQAKEVEGGNKNGNKQAAIKEYQRAYKDYYDSVDQWRQQIVDYEMYYNAYKPFLIDPPKKKQNFFLYKLMVFLNGPEKQHPNGHEYFLNKMKKRDDELKADLLELQTPKKKRATPYKMRLAMV